MHLIELTPADNGDEGSPSKVFINLEHITGMVRNEEKGTTELMILGNFHNVVPVKEDLTNKEVVIDLNSIEIFS
jgi:hypothetical protein